MKEIAETKQMRRGFNPPVRCLLSAVCSPRNRANSHIHFAPHAYELADRGETEATADLLPLFLPPRLSREKFLEWSSRGGSDGAAVDDPGVRGGGGGGGGRAGHASGAPRRAGSDRRAHVLAPAAARQRDTLRCLPAPRCVRRPVLPDLLLVPLTPFRL